LDCRKSIAFSDLVLTDPLVSLVRL